MVLPSQDRRTKAAPGDMSRNDLQLFGIQLVSSILVPPDTDGCVPGVALES
jgi:hypothetical protein